MREYRTYFKSNEIRKVNGTLRYVMTLFLKTLVFVTLEKI